MFYIELAELNSIASFAPKEFRNMSSELHLLTHGKCIKISVDVHTVNIGNYDWFFIVQLFIHYVYLKMLQEKILNIHYSVIIDIHLYLINEDMNQIRELLIVKIFIYLL